VVALATPCSGGRARVGHRSALGRMLRTALAAGGGSRRSPVGRDRLRLTGRGAVAVPITCGADDACRPCGRQGPSARIGADQGRLPGSGRGRRRRWSPARGGPGRTEPRPPGHRRRTDHRWSTRRPTGAASISAGDSRLVVDCSSRSEYRVPVPAREPAGSRTGPGPANHRLPNRTRPLHQHRRTPGGLRRRRQEIRIAETPCPSLSRRRLMNGGICGCCCRRRPAG